MKKEATWKTKRATMKLTRKSISCSTPVVTMVDIESNAFLFVIVACSIGHLMAHLTHLSASRLSSTLLIDHVILGFPQAPFGCSTCSL
jgi:hypothetical protein